MSSDWEKILEMQKAISDRYELFIPDTLLLTAIQRKINEINLAMLPYKDYLYSFETIKLSNPVLQSIRRIQYLTVFSVPDIAKVLTHSASALEVFKFSNFSVPDFLYEFPEINNLIRKRTYEFSFAIDSLLRIFTQKSIELDFLPRHMTSPIVSCSTHFVALNQLQYFDIDLNEEVEEELFDIIEEYSDKAEEKIKKTNEEWLILLYGAKESLLSGNPDKIRHAISSLRELITQIINLFAPDNEIIKLYHDKSAYHNGTPTRRTRLHFILSRKYDNPAFHKVLDADIAACLELFNLYQKGVHEVKSSISNEQLLFIIKRSILVIEQLI